MAFWNSWEAVTNASVQPRIFLYTYPYKNLSENSDRFWEISFLYTLRKVGVVMIGRFFSFPEPWHWYSFFSSYPELSFSTKRMTVSFPFSSKYSQRALNHLFCTNTWRMNHDKWYPENWQLQRRNASSQLKVQRKHFQWIDSTIWVEIEQQTTKNRNSKSLLSDTALATVNELQAGCSL